MNLLLYTINNLFEIKLNIVYVGILWIYVIKLDTILNLIFSWKKKVFIKFNRIIELIWYKANWES